MNEWYAALNKPPLTPPAAYFPIAWGILYSLMAISFFIIVAKQASKDKYIAVNLFLIQLMLNFIWSYVFFELKSISFALVDVVLLFIVLLFTVKYFCKLSKFAAILLIPYLLQVIFAIYLNLGILIVN
jgi:tryptophan-rich sensory protein